MDSGDAAGWEVRHDEASGQVYYWNSVTGETSWEPPPHLALPPPWTEAYDESGHVYYLNAETMDTQWTRPSMTNEGETEPATTSSALAMSGGRGRRPSTAEQMNELNRLLSGDMDDDTAETGVKSTSTDAACPWMLFVNESDGQPYYYNNSTGECLWEAPEEFLRFHQEQLHQSDEKAKEGQSTASPDDHELKSPQVSTRPKSGPKKVAITPEFEEKVRRAIAAVSNTPMGSSRVTLVQTPTEQQLAPQTGRSAGSGVSAQSDVSSARSSGGQSRPPSGSARSRSRPPSAGVASSRLVVHDSTPVLEEVAGTEEITPKESGQNRADDTAIEVSMEQIQNTTGDGLPELEILAAQGIQRQEEGGNRADGTGDATVSTIQPVEQLTEDINQSNDRGLLAVEMNAAVTVRDEENRVDCTEDAAHYIRSSTPEGSVFAGENLSVDVGPPPQDRTIDISTNVVERLSPQIDSMFQGDVAVDEPVNSAPVTKEIPAEIAPDCQADADVIPAVVSPSNLSTADQDPFSSKEVSYVLRDASECQNIIDNGSKLRQQEASNFVSQKEDTNNTTEGSSISVEQVHPQDPASPRLDSSDAPQPPTASPARSSIKPVTSTSAQAQLPTKLPSVLDVANYFPSRRVVSNHKEVTAATPVAITRKKIDVSSSPRVRRSSQQELQEMENLHLAKLDARRKQEEVAKRAQIAEYQRIYAENRRAFELEKQRVVREKLERDNQRDNDAELESQQREAARLEARRELDEEDMRDKVVGDEANPLLWELVKAPDRPTAQSLLRFKTAWTQVVDSSQFADKMCAERARELQERIDQLRRSSWAVDSQLKSLELRLLSELNPLTAQQRPLQAKYAGKHRRRLESMLNTIILWQRVLDDGDLSTSSYWGNTHARYSSECFSSDESRRQCVLRDWRGSAGGDSLMHVAAWNGLEEHARLLIEQGADANLVDSSASHRTPLHEACGAGHAVVVQLLLESGATLTAVDSSGDSALHIACRGGWTRVVRMLLAAAKARESTAAIFNLRNGKGARAIDVTRLPSLMEELQQYDGELNVHSLQAHGDTKAPHLTRIKHK